MTKKNLSAEDSDLFRKTVGEVHSVKKDKVHGEGQAKLRPFPKLRQTHVHDPLAYEADIAPVGIEDEISFIRENLPKNCLVKLRQGYFIPEAEIDLHGLNSNAAKRELLSFVRDCLRSGCRCVHVVHGKGYRSQERYPILKNNINLWLRQHKEVLAFCSAMPKDGGAGAVYVLLQLT